MLSYFKALIQEPELFLELAESFELSPDGQFALDAAIAMSED